MTDPALLEVVQIELDGRRFTFCLDDVDGVQFWRVTSSRRSWPTPCDYTGTETPDTFRDIAQSGIEHYGL